MKIAFTGKGGVGKTTLAGLTAHHLNRQGRRVLAVDADPDANLARALGVPPEDYHRIVPISQQRQLIEERTGAKVREFGQLFRLNPAVEDIADSHALSVGNIALLVMGGADRAGGGCACPENVLLRALMTELVLGRQEAVVLDMEAGIEHLGRGTAGAIDTFVIVVEPSASSLESGQRIAQLARDLGMERLLFLGNRLVDQQDEALVRAGLKGEQVVALIPQDRGFQTAERSSQPAWEWLEERTRAQLQQFLEILG